jgi:hypothetical protein
LVNEISVQENYIISSCVVRNNAVIKNNREIFAVPASDVSSFLAKTYHFLQIDYPKFYKMDHLSKLGFLAAEILLKGEDIKNYLPQDTGIVLTNANSSLDADIKYFESAKTFASPGLFVYTLPNIVMGEICIRNNFKGENAFFVFENFDAGFLEQYVSGLFNKNILKLCICGWVDMLQEGYSAVLFLAGRHKKNGSQPFSKAVMEAVFNNNK